MRSYLAAILCSLSNFTVEGKWNKCIGRKLCTFFFFFYREHKEIEVLPAFFFCSRFLERLLKRSLISYITWRDLVVFRWVWVGIFRFFLLMSPCFFRFMLFINFLIRKRLISLTWMIFYDVKLATSTHFFVRFIIC